MSFLNKAKEEFKIEPVTSAQMETLVAKCGNIYSGKAPWVDNEKNVKSIDFTKTLCEETARLTTLAIGITIDGSARAEYLQKQVDAIYFKIREWTEYALAYGTIVLKPNGDSIDVVLPGEYIITAVENGKITGIIFRNVQQSDDKKKWYIRLEYHHWMENIYVIDNKCFIGDSENDDGKPIDIKDTPWKDLQEQIGIENLEKPLYGVIRTPNANNKEIGSASGLPLISNTLEELKDLDVAYSRFATEIFDSEKLVLLDADRLVESGRPVGKGPQYFERRRNEMKLPHYIKNVNGSSTEEFYQEINPQMNTEERVKGINHYLSMIGFKCGYSNGYFVFDGQTGMVTATQVEADDRRTIQSIKDIRDQLESGMDGLIYAMDKFADLYGLAPVGVYEVNYDFGDITYSYELDKQTWWTYVQSGKMPFWRYLVKFENFSEEEARKIQEEGQPKEEGLFKDE